MDIGLEVKVLPSLFVMSNPLLVLVLILLSRVVLMVLIPESGLKYIDLSLLWLYGVIGLHAFTGIGLADLPLLWTDVVKRIVFIIAHRLKLVLTFFFILYLVVYFEDGAIHLF
jgi:hypothetical protein